MLRNLFLQTYLRRTSNRLRVEGLGGRLARLAVGMAAAAALVPLVEPVFLGFLAGPQQIWAEGLEAVVLRACVIVIGLLSLDVYSAMIRSPDRHILDILPVDPAAVATYSVVRVGWERLWVLPVLGVLLGPLWWSGDPWLWGTAMLCVAGAYMIGLTGSATMHLLAVQIAESPRAAPLLDLLRGQNPRAQAAFLYAPGAVLAVCGVVIGAASGGAAQVWQGNTSGWPYLMAPIALAVLGWPAVPRLAKRSWFRASVVLSEIDARYARLIDREEARRVYLDWTLRFLPDGLVPYALKDLRHGWRARRGWISGSWAIGVGAAIVTWRSDPTAALHGAAVAAAGAWLCLAVGVLLDRDDPPFLQSWLGNGGASGGWARLVVLVGWGQALPWLPALAVAIRHGMAAAISTWVFAQAAVVAASLLATVCGRMGRRGVFLYAPAAAIGAAGGAAWLLT